MYQRRDDVVQEILVNWEGGALADNERRDNVKPFGGFIGSIIKLLNRSVFLTQLI